MKIILILFFTILFSNTSIADDPLELYCEREGGAAKNAFGKEGYYIFKNEKKKKVQLKVFKDKIIWKDSAIDTANRGFIETYKIVYIGQTKDIRIMSISLTDGPPEKGPLGLYAQTLSLWSGADKSKINYALTSNWGPNIGPSIQNGNCNVF